ncbi:MAG: hypothetical protein E6Y83_17070 [Clostridium butyricum]|nr:hypothetical protein [Clostridium butyricum]
MSSIDSSNFIVSFDYSADEIEELKRNIETLLSIPEGTVPLDRNFGINNDFVSYPLDVAENMYVLEITEKVEKYESRVQVKEVNFIESADGALIPSILFSKAGGD